jgi:hypothetical protein
MVWRDGRVAEGAGLLIHYEHFTTMHEHRSTPHEHWIRFASTAFSTLALIMRSHAISLLQSVATWSDENKKSTFRREHST